MKSEIARRLPEPDDKVYFPERDSKPSSSWKKEWALNKAGEDNLVLALEYGSKVTGDPSATSIYDFILVVKDKKAFHRRVLESNPEDYGAPKSAWVHALLNRGPSYYQTKTEVVGEDGVKETHKMKYIVIEEKKFIKACNGSLPRKARVAPGGHGLSIAGRVQKVALDPLYITDDDESKKNIKRAINKARIDGVWLALGTVGDTFNLKELESEYGFLSYRWDLRVEKPGKAQAIIDKSPDDYEAMLTPILEKFSKAEIIRPSATENLVWEKKLSPTRGEIYRRTWPHKIRSGGRNFIKNPITGGVKESKKYALDKIKRVIEHKKIASSVSSS